MQWIRGLLYTLLLSVPVWSADLDYFLIDGVAYDPLIPAPDTVFGAGSGRGLGDVPVHYGQMVAYLSAVAEASDRITSETIAYSHEGRPILFFVVTSPENHARLDDIRRQHLARSGGGAPMDADAPVITWVNYGVHGSEASAMDAVLPTLYTLAAGQSEAMDRLLADSVILITAMFNPDGNARRASWLAQHGGAVTVTDPAHDIHSRWWPGGRTNHYWFDLNRQWLLQTQPESRGWLAKWHDWKPHVSGDMHEMGSNATYYFHPGVPTRKNPLIPAKGRALLSEMAGYHTDFFDADRGLYYSEESFDNFYIGKGSTYPQVNGGLGILFEAGGQMGIAKDSDQGIKTYAANIRNHYRTSLTTMFGAHAMRAKLHAYRTEFFAGVKDLAAKDPVKGYVFRAPEDPARIAAFLDLLARHEIAVHRVAGTLRADDKSWGPQSYIVSLDQPQYRMAKGIFGRVTSFEDTVFYDVSGWTLPLAYGLDYAEIRGRIGRNLGDPATAAMPVGQAPHSVPYAFVYSWAEMAAARVTNRLLQDGVEVRLGLQPVTIKTASGPRAFDRGMVIVPLDNQPLDDAALLARMQRLAADTGLTIHGALSGSTIGPGGDLGGRVSAADLVAPTPLLITGDGVSPYDAGEMWHQLDLRTGMAVTLVRHSRLSGIDLGRYSHVLIPGGWDLSGLDQHAPALKNWMNTGGTVVAIRQGAAWAGEHLGSRGGAHGEGDKAKKPRAPERLVYGEKGQNDARDIIGGAVFESDLDITHPMGFGFVRPTIASHRNTVITLPVPQDPYAQVAVYTDTPLLSGYASARRVAQLRGTPMLTAERRGKGALILFADNPNFRATYRGTEKLFMNALFFSKAFQNARSADDAVEAMAEALE